MTNMAQLLDALRQIRRTGYGSKLPDVSDTQFIELADYYMRSGESERERIRSLVTEDTRLLLIGFSDRLSIIADRTRDSKMLLFALAAHSIEDFRYDERENTFRLALVNHVAEKLGKSPSRLFETAARLSSPRASELLLSFLNRPAELRSLRVMGIVEELTPDGVNYRHA